MPVDSVRPTRARLIILGLITVATMINYLDRTVISVAAPLLARDLGLNAALMGVAFSAFSWTYAAAQIPGGILLDRLGVRSTYYLSVTIWSLCTLLQGLSIGLGTLVGARLALGIAEAPAYPCNSRILNTWFPQHERARATGVYSVGQYFGLAFLSPVLFWITAEFGWRALFLAVGTVGVGFGLVWLALYRDPDASKRANRAEIDFIRNGGGLANAAAAARFDWSVMRQRGGAESGRQYEAVPAADLPARHGRRQVHVDEGPVVADFRKWTALGCVSNRVPARVAAAVLKRISVSLHVASGSEVGRDRCRPHRKGWRHTR